MQLGAILFCLLFLSATAKHLYYALEKNVRYVSDSKSLVELTKCKDLCLQMKNRYDKFSFRFHRMILRQPNTDVKYFVGKCEWKRKVDTKYEPFSKFPFTDSAWKNYDLKCGNEHLALSPEMLKALNLSRMHSNFLYFDDGNFINKQPFADLPQLMATVAQLQKKTFGSTQPM